MYYSETHDTRYSEARATTNKSRQLIRTHWPYLIRPLKKKICKNKNQMVHYDGVRNGEHEGEGKVAGAGAGARRSSSRRPLH